MLCWIKERSMGHHPPNLVKSDSSWAIETSGHICGHDLFFSCLIASFYFFCKAYGKKIFFNYLHGAHLSASLCFNFLFWKLNFWNIDIYAWLGLPMAGKIVFAAPSRPLVMQQIEACHNIVGIPQVRCSLQSSMWWYAQFFAS